MSPKGATQNLVGYRTDDVELFKQGNFNKLQELLETSKDEDIIFAAVGGYLRRRWGMSTNLGSFRLSELDDARDQWANHFCRPEQEKLIRELQKEIKKK